MKETRRITSHSRDRCVVLVCWRLVLDFLVQSICCTVKQLVTRSLRVQLAFWRHFGDVRRVKKHNTQVVKQPCGDLAFGRLANEGDCWGVSAKVSF